AEVGDGEHDDNRRASSAPAASGSASHSAGLIPGTGCGGRARRGRDLPCNPRRNDASDRARDVAEPAGTDAGPAATPAPPRPIRISPTRQQLIGVRTATVELRDLTLAIRTGGIISYDERRLIEIHTKIAGWVERVDVDYVGITRCRSVGPADASRTGHAQRQPDPLPRAR